MNKEKDFLSIKNSSKLKAFTLIELSIVIIIIGIIIGGIMTGSALVKQGQLRSIMNDFSKTLTAVEVFRLKFDALPGDFTQAGAIWSSVANCPDSASAAGCNGNGNNFFNGGETHRIWQHLSLANMVPGQYTGLVAGTTSGYAGGINALDSSILGGVYALRGTGGVLYSQPASLNTITFLKEDNNGVINAEDSYAIDAKIDDGDPSKGKIIVVRSITGSCVNASSAAATALYLMTDPLPSCKMYFILN